MLLRGWTVYIFFAQIDSSNQLNVKLSNISLTRQLTIDYESTCDEFVHLPPEAIRNMTYDTSSEIYSLGIMLWEMWYGKEAFSEMKGKSLKVFLTTVEGGHRPQLETLDSKIALKWSDIISECWKEDAKERKTLSDCASEIEAIFQSSG